MKCQSELDLVMDEGCENDAVATARLAPFGTFHLCLRCLEEYIERGVEASPIAKELTSQEREIESDVQWNSDNYLQNLED